MSKISKEMVYLGWLMLYMVNYLYSPRRLFFHASWKEYGGKVLVNSQGIEDVILSEMARNK